VDPSDTLSSRRNPGVEDYRREGTWASIGPKILDTMKTHAKGDDTSWGWDILRSDSCCKGAVRCAGTVEPRVDNVGPRAGNIWDGTLEVEVEAMGGSSVPAGHVTQIDYEGVRIEEDRSLLAQDLVGLL
jgi:hypothetical protein